MKTQNISILNGIEIIAVEKDGEVLVPIRPICDALTLSFSSQLQKIKDDSIFADSTVLLSNTVAADGKEREMLCLPLMLVFLWLGSINPNNVGEKARPAVSAYRLECASVLYEHFTGSMRRTIETNNAEIELLQQINAAITDEKEAKNRRRKAEEALSKLRSERLSSQPSLFP